MLKDAVVNFATEKLSVSYDADAISFGDIKAKVEKAGYKLIREDEQKVEEKRKKLDEKGKLLVEVNIIINICSTTFNNNNGTYGWYAVT